MRKSAFVVCIAIQLLVCGKAFGLNWSEWFPSLNQVPVDAHVYVGLEGQRFQDLGLAFQAGGFNIIGPHQNFPDVRSGDCRARFGGVTLGLEIGSPSLQALGLGYVRVEWKRAQTDDSINNFVTGSFPGPPDPPTYFYSTQVAMTPSTSDVYSVYYQQPLYILSPTLQSFIGSGRGSTNQSSFMSQFLSPSLELSLFAGYGAGTGETPFRGSTDDTVVAGSGPQSTVKYTVRTLDFGVELKMTECVSVYWCHRRIRNDISQEALYNVALAIIGLGGVPAGNYTLDLASAEVANRNLLGVRFRF